MGLVSSPAGTVFDQAKTKGPILMRPPDLSAFDALDGGGDPGDPREVIQQMRAKIERTREVRDRAAELVGSAQSEDGYVTVECTNAAGIKDVVFDPRVMRMQSQDLAALIVEVAAEARADLDRQRGEVLAELKFGTPDVEESEAALAEMTSAYTRSMGDIHTMFARFRDGLGR
jgi:DNA-binding protein YbaB